MRERRNRVSDEAFTHRTSYPGWVVPSLYMYKAQSVTISREGLILTLSILPCPQGRIFWSTPCRKIDAERLSVLHQNSGGIGKSIPSALQISLDPRDFPRASPSGNLSGLGKSFGLRGWISQYLPSFGGVPTFSHHQSFCREWIRKFFPVGSVKIDSVKINPSLGMMRELKIHPLRDFPRAQGLINLPGVWGDFPMLIGTPNLGDIPP